MASTLTLPGKGKGRKLDKRVVMVAGAGAVGMLGYAWWTRGAGGYDDELVATDPEAYDALGFPLTGTDTYTPPNIVAGTGGGSGDDSGAPTTNAEWAQAAVDALWRYGSDPTSAASAIGKFLQRQQLTAAEADIVRQALAVVGPPPTAGPWTIVPVTNGAATAMPAPTGLSAIPAATSITWSWQPVTGAQGYDVELIAGVSTVVERATVTSTSWRPAKVLLPAHSYRIAVYARNSAGQRGARTTGTARTTNQPNASGMTITGLRTEGSNAQDITWAWNPVPGARSYYVELIAGANTVIRKQEINPARWRAGGGLQPNHSYRIRVRARDSANRLGPSVTKTARTRR